MREPERDKGRLLDIIQAADHIASLASETIDDQVLNKLNRLKKVNLEAFFYCFQLEQLR